MSVSMKLLADVEWLRIGSTNEYAELKKWIAHICRDVTHAGCIDELCVNDICVGFRQKGYEVIAKKDLDAIRDDADRLAAQLRDLEWSGFEYVDDFEVRVCPKCRKDTDEGHAPNCELAAALAAHDALKGKTK